MNQYRFQDSFLDYSHFVFSVVVRGEVDSRAELRRMQEEIDRKAAEVEQLEREAAKMRKMNTSHQLSQYDQERKGALVQLARKIEPVKRKGNHIGIFGLTSTGKSTIVNSLLGQHLAETGAGETTTEITPYHGNGFTLWDAPGRNDDLSYSNEKFLKFIKGLTRRLIVIQSTIKENVDLMRLLDEMELSYDILVNKFDDVDEDERVEFQQTIRSERRRLGLKRLNHIFFLSAKYPQMFPDWLILVNSLT